MTDIPNLYTLIFALVQAGGFAFVWWDNRERMRRAADKVDAVGHAVNGVTAALVKTAREVGYADGLAAGIAAERAVAAALKVEQDAAAVKALAVVVADAERHEGEGSGPS